MWFIASFKLKGIYEKCYNYKILVYIMNKKIILSIIAISWILPFTANAQYSPDGVYFVLEAGTVQNKAV